MKSHCGLDPREQSSVKYILKLKHFHWRNCIWKYHLPKWRPSCLGLNVLRASNPTQPQQNMNILIFWNVCCITELFKLFVWDSGAHICISCGSRYELYVTFKSYLPLLWWPELGLPLQWRHNERDGVPNYLCLDCSLNRLIRCRWEKISKLRVTGLCDGNSPVTGEFPSQRGSKAEHVSIW